MPGPFRQKRQCSFSRPFEKTNKSIVLHILWIKHSTKNCAQVASGKNIQKAGLTWATCGIKQIDTQDFKNSTLCGCGGSDHAGDFKTNCSGERRFKTRFSAVPFICFLGSSKRTTCIEKDRNKILKQPQSCWICIHIYIYIHTIYMFTQFHGKKLPHIWLAMDTESSRKRRFKWAERRSRPAMIEKILVLLAWLFPTEILHWISYLLDYWSLKLNFLTNCDSQEFLESVCTTEMVKDYRDWAKKKKAPPFFWNHSIKFPMDLALQFSHQAGQNDYYFTLRCDDPNTTDTLEEQADFVEVRSCENCCASIFMQNYVIHVPAQSVKPLLEVQRNFSSLKSWFELFGRETPYANEVKAHIVFWESWDMPNIRRLHLQAAVLELNDTIRVLD